MFKFLKDKLKSAISKISESVEKEGKVEEEIVGKPLEQKPEKEKEESNASEIHSQERTRSQVTGFFSKLKDKFVGKEKKNAEDEKKEKSALKDEFEIPEFKTEEESKHKTGTKEISKTIGHKFEIKETHKPIGKKTEAKTRTIAEKFEEPIRTLEKEPEKKGFFEALKEKIITTKINEEQFEKLFWELELALMENNVAVEVIEKIKTDLKSDLVDKPIKRTKVEETIQETLRSSIGDLFESSDFDLIEEINDKKEKPYVIAFFGINGSGKTTSIAKLANMLKEKKISCVLAAADTFRAASIEQLQQHADKLGVKIIKHNYGADPAAVAFDAIKHAKSKNIDVVLVDTAGRMHSNQNLIDEMKKIIRVAKPDLKIFVGESITGNDCVEQAKTFNETVGIDGIILAKADIDEKGGAAVSVSYITKKPILYLGVGQEYKDLKPFDSKVIIENLGLV